MKNKKTALKLAKETVSKLIDKQLDRVAGGGASAQIGSCRPSYCASQCPAACWQ